MALQRAVKSGAIERVDHGVYRIVGAGYDPHQQLRVAWLRLTPELSARERTLRPHLWVSHRSAAGLFDLGVAIADVPEFISDRRLQTRANVKIHRRSGGLQREEWTVHDGFAVTTPARTIADLSADHMDGGHLGRIASDALVAGLVTHAEVEEALEGRADLDTILALATGEMR
jgi:predicted transcriptional regulator of viral defense system